MEKCYRTKNIYLAAFLISQDSINLGKIYIDDLKKDNKAWIETLYEDEFSNMLNNFVDVYENKKAICKLHAYQENIRFIMHIVNLRKSGINEEETKLNSKTINKRK